MARNVADLKVLFEAMQGPDDGDTCAAPVPVRWPDEGEMTRIKIGYFEDDGRTPVTSEIRQAVRTAAEALKRAGFQVKAFRPEGLEEARALWKKFFVKVGGMLIKPMFHGREADISPMLREFLEWSDNEPESDRGLGVGSVVSTGYITVRISRADARVSHLALPTRRHSSISSPRKITGS